LIDLPFMAGIAERVKGMLLKPRSTWCTIDTEPTTPAALYKGYVIPLAGLSALARLIGVAFVGFPVIARPPLRAVLVWVVLYFAFELLAVDVIAFVIDWLAPRLGGQHSPVQALKVAAYARTPLWVAGVLLIIPTLDVVAITAGALYSIYLLWLGIPELMKAPKHRIPVYALVTVVAAAGVYGLIRLLVNTILAMAFGFAVDARDYTS
jgi:hypothetical protein